MVITRVLFVIATIWSAPCLATNDKWDSCVSDGSFYDLKTLAKELSLFARVSQATLRTAVSLSLPYSSSVRISDKGHLLMSSHQLEVCFAEQGLYKNGFIEKSSQDIICEIAIDGSRFKAKVLMARSCDENTASNLTKRYQKNPFTPLSDEIKRCLSGADIAIVQLQPNGDPIVADCLPMNLQRQPLGTKIMLASYPQKTTRPRVANSDGREQFASFGKIIDQPYCTDNLNNDTTSIEAIKYLLPREYQVDIASYKGSSGGPYINEKGEIVAIHIASISPQENVTCRGSAFATPTSLIMDTANAWRNDLKWDEIQCPPK